jgi:peptide deformylase
MILKLVSHNSPVLRQKCETFNYAIPQTDAVELSKNLYETLMSTKYLGLSAPQVGLAYRVFALRTTPGIVCFNPRVVDRSEEVILLDEMCMSFEHLAVPIKRPKKIKVRYFEPNGNVKTEVFDGLTARYFLHELDHLDGILYTQHANKMHLERAMRKKKIIDRQSKRDQKDE